MKLLLSSDDGIFALGISTLANTLAAAGHEVYVVCPDRERSATGHGLTLHEPIRAEQVDTFFDKGIKAWSCSGTPADFATELLADLAENPLPYPMLLNVNVSSIKAERIAGVALTRQGLRRCVDIFPKRVDPRGKTYYWLAGEALQDVEQPNDLRLPPEIKTDVQAIKENYITVTPLQYNLTCGFGIKHFHDRQSFCSFN